MQNRKLEKILIELGRMGDEIEQWEIDRMDGFSGEITTMRKQ